MPEYILELPIAEWDKHLVVFITMTYSLLPVPAHAHHDGIDTVLYAPSDKMAGVFVHEVRDLIISSVCLNMLSSIQDKFISAPYVLFANERSNCIVVFLVGNLCRPSFIKHGLQSAVIGEGHDVVHIEVDCAYLFNFVTVSGSSV